MAKGRSYLYVIGPDPQNVREPWVKIGRSNDPKLRRSQLQVGQGETLAVRGTYEVPVADASRLEIATHEAMKPLLIKGEVFRCEYQVGCAFAEQFAQHGEADEFLGLLIAKVLADAEFSRLARMRNVNRRDVPDELHAAFQASHLAFKAADEALFAYDFDRAAKIDPIAASIFRFRVERAERPSRRTKRVLTPPQPRIGPSLFKRRNAGGTTA